MSNRNYAGEGFEETVTRGTMAGATRAAEYEINKHRLKVKISILLTTTFIFTVLGFIAHLDMGEALMLGLAGGMFFYIGSRIRNTIRIGWIFSIIISCVYIGIVIYLLEAFVILGVIAVFLPVFDIGMSVYKVIKNRP